ncbi:MAG: shikimate kinase [Pirellulales bacterium]
MNLLLIGYRGTGKSAVARLVAERLGWRWLDADVELERRAGKSIAAIFADDGEPMFRDLESEMLAELVRLDRHVLALGGGVVLRPENRALIKQAGSVVWLTADPETIQARVQSDPTTSARRPNLTRSGGLDEVRQLLAQREPFYRECAGAVVDTSGRSVAEVAEAVVESFRVR